MKKSTLAKSQKPTRKSHRGKIISQKAVRKADVPTPESRILKRVKSNLSQMKAAITDGKNTHAYEIMAQELSAIAGLTNGHVWGWRYVASVLSDSILPSKKFIDAVNLYCENINTRKKQYFYFVRRYSFVMIYERACLREIIRAHQAQRNYKMVTYKKYMQVKKSATVNRKR